MSEARAAAGIEAGRGRWARHALEISTLADEDEELFKLGIETFSLWVWCAHAEPIPERLERHAVQ